MKMDDGSADHKLSLDMTPLIDIVFLLVLFFAVSTSFISGEDLQLLKDNVLNLGQEVEQLEQDKLTEQQRASDIETTLSRSLADRDRQLASTRSDLEQALQREADGAASLARLRDQLAALNDRRDDLQRQLTERDGENSRLLSQRDEAQALVAAANRQIEQLRTDAEQLTLQNSRAQTLFSDTESQLLAARTLAATLESERDELRGELDAQTGRLESLTAQLDSEQTQYQDELSNLRSQTEALQRQRDDVEKTLQTTRQNLQSAQQENENARAAFERQRSEFEQTIQSAQLDRQNLQAELDDRRTQYEQSLQAVEQDRDKLRSELDSTRDELEKSLREVALENERMRAELEKFRDIAELDREQIERVIRAQKQISEGLGDYLADNKLGIKREQGQLILQLSDQILFASGRAVLKPEGLAVLRDLGQLLSERMGDLQVQIGGHTDNIPVGGVSGPLSDNWGLSAARAVNVVRFFEDELGVDARRLSAVGYGEHHPVGDNATGEGRAKNRRIEIVLLPQ